MKPRPRLSIALLASFITLILAILPTASAPAQAYSGRPKLIVIVVIDQFRGDYLNRDRAEFKGRGFRLFTEEGAWFTDCYFDYAKTAPFAPGEYHERVAPVDLAATLASLAGINQPSAAVGRVLIEAIKPTRPSGAQ